MTDTSPAAIAALLRVIFAAMIEYRAEEHRALRKTLAFARDLVPALAAERDALAEQLKTVLDREAATHARYDAERDAGDLIIRDLTLIVNRLAKYAPDDKVAEVFDYLHRKNLASPTRAALPENPMIDYADLIARATRHLNLSDNHEAGLILMVTQRLVRDMTAALRALAELEARK